MQSSGHRQWPSAEPLTHQGVLPSDRGRVHSQSAGGGVTTCLMVEEPARSRLVLVTHSLSPKHSHQPSPNHSHQPSSALTQPLPPALSQPLPPALSPHPTTPTSPRPTTPTSPHPTTPTSPRSTTPTSPHPTTPTSPHPTTRTNPHPIPPTHPLTLLLCLPQSVQTPTGTVLPSTAESAGSGSALFPEDGCAAC